MSSWITSLGAHLKVLLVIVISRAVNTLN